jgi:hypothetical protein
MSDEEDIFFLKPNRGRKGGYIDFDRNLKVWSIYTHKDEGKPIELIKTNIKKVQAFLTKWRPVYLDLVEKGSKKEQEKVTEQEVYADDSTRVVLNLNVFQKNPNLQLSSQWKERSTGTWQFCKGGNLLNDVDPVVLDKYIEHCCAVETASKRSKSKSPDGKKAWKKLKVESDDESEVSPTPPPAPVLPANNKRRKS